MSSDKRERDGDEEDEEDLRLDSVKRTKMGQADKEWDPEFENFM